MLYYLDTVNVICDVEGNPAYQSLGIHGCSTHPRQSGKTGSVAGGGYGIYWPDIDEDLSTEGLLRGATAPRPAQANIESTAGRKTKRST